MKAPRIHFAAGNRGQIICARPRAGAWPSSTVDPSLVTCARCRKFLSTTFVTFDDVRPGERFIIHKRGGKVWRGVKVLEFIDQSGATRNSIEVGSGRFWTMASPTMPVEVYLPRG